MRNFELDLTSLLFYECITVVSSTMLLYYMYGRRYILFFLPPGFIIGRSIIRVHNITEVLVILYVTLNTAFENESRLLPPQKKKKK